MKTPFPTGHTDAVSPDVSFSAADQANAVLPVMFHVAKYPTLTAPTIRPGVILILALPTTGALAALPSMTQETSPRHRIRVTSATRS